MAEEMVNLNSVNEKIIDAINSLTMLNEFLKDFIDDPGEEKLAIVMRALEEIDSKNELVRSRVKVILEECVGAPSDEIIVEASSDGNGYKI